MEGEYSNVSNHVILKFEHRWKWFKSHGGLKMVKSPEKLHFKMANQIDSIGTASDVDAFLESLCWYAGYGLLATVDAYGFHHSWKHIDNERHKQRWKWGDEHDDRLSHQMWAQILLERVAKADIAYRTEGKEEHIQRLIEAIAVAAAAFDASMRCEEGT